MVHLAACLCLLELLGSTVPGFESGFLDFRLFWLQTKIKFTGFTFFDLHWPVRDIETYIRMPFIGTTKELYGLYPFSFWKAQKGDAKPS